MAALRGKPQDNESENASIELVSRHWGGMDHSLESLTSIANVLPWDRSSALIPDSIAQSFATHEPLAIVEPDSVEQLCAVVEKLNRDRMAMVPMGQGSKLSWGAPIKTDLPVVLISTARLNQLIDHASGDLTVTTQSGMPFHTLQEMVQRSGQFCAIDPSYGQQATIGGIVATGDSGALRHRYNSVRDMVLGIEFVRSDGKLVKAGGRVVKNVAGYDLMKLLTGSYGTLGILTQVTLRLYPNQESSQTLFITGEVDHLQTAIQRILNSGLTPTAMDCLSAGAIAALGLCSSSPSSSDQSLGLLIQFQGLKESVQEQCDRIFELSQTKVLSVQRQPTDQALWQQLGDCMTQGEMLCKWAVRSSEILALLMQIQSLLPHSIARFHINSGLGQLRIDETVSAAELQKIRSDCESKGGFLTILKAPLDVKKSLEVWGFRGNGSSWMRSIQQQFDPLHLMSPGRMEIK